MGATPNDMAAQMMQDIKATCVCVVAFNSGQNLEALETGESKYHCRSRILRAGQSITVYRQHGSGLFLPDIRAGSGI